MAWAPPPPPVLPRYCPASNGTCPETMVTQGGDPYEGGCCVCAPGHQPSGPRSCELCPLATYKEAFDMRPCSPCDHNSNTSATGSTDVNHCICVVWPTTGVGNQCKFDARWMAVLIGAPIFCIGICAIFTICYYNRYKNHSKAMQARKRELVAKRARVRLSVQSLLELNFPYCVMSLHHLRQAGRMVQHEEALRAGSLTALSSWEDAVEFATASHVVFLSHQWLGYSFPDPHGAQYEEALRALSMLCERLGVTEDELYVWLDYHSIPQLNSNIKRAAISSIAVYAACARYFIVVAPKATHVDSGAHVGAESYAARGWCRLEQWANLAMGGLSNAFLLDSGGLRKLAEEPGWVRKAVQVFDGAFTVASDKSVLVDVILGLYGFSLLDTTGRSDELIAFVNEMRASVFPEEYFADLLSLLEVEVSLWNAAREPDDEPSQKTNGNDLDLLHYFELAASASLGFLLRCGGCVCYVCCGPNCYRNVFQRAAGEKSGKAAMEQKIEIERNRSIAASIIKARQLYSDIKQCDPGTERRSLLGDEVLQVNALRESSEDPCSNRRGKPDPMLRILRIIRLISKGRSVQEMLLRIFRYQAADPHAPMDR